MAQARDVAGRRYALAVMEIARTNGTIDHWAEAVEGLEALTSASSFVAALQGDGMTDERFQAIVRQAIPDIAPVEMNLLRLLRRKNRLQLGPSIASYYRELHDQERGIVRATVRTAVPLEEARLRALSEQLSTETGGTVALESEVDEAMLGGVVLRIGDRLLDGSVRSSLRRLRRQLLEEAPVAPSR